jgi:hypothetical protein
MSEDSPIARRAAFHSFAFAGQAGSPPSSHSRVERECRACASRSSSGVTGVLDAFAHTTNGVAMLWPVSGKRLLEPWHVFPNPLANRELFSRRGLCLLGAELIVFIPLWALTARPRHGRQPA